MGQTDLERQKEYRRMIQFIFETDKRVLQKCPYRKKNGQILLFIGDPVRVKVKYENIRETLRAKKKRWMEQLKQRRTKLKKAA